MKFQDPPSANAAGGRPRAYVEVANALRKEPGRWALVMEGAKSASSAQGIKRGTASFEAGQFDAVSRKSPKGGFDIYVRYIGSAK